MTSYLFLDGKFALDRLRALRDAVGRDRLVVDLRFARPKQVHILVRKTAHWQFW